jgi:ketosteroid isomerase-like protein
MSNRFSRSRKLLTVLFAVLAVCGLALFMVSPVGISSDESESVKLDRELQAIVQNQAAAWNQGDVPLFMSAYWKDDRMTFSAGGTTQRGWQKTLERYLSRYPTPKEMGKLTFSQLETVQLATDSALMLGRWNLEKEKPAEGNFTLVWRKMPEGWRIIHDHSSSLTNP